MIGCFNKWRILMQVAQKLGKADQICLLKSRKLVLIMDLEHTLIHTGINMSHKREVK